MKEQKLDNHHHGQRERLTSWVMGTSTLWVSLSLIFKGVGWVWA